MVPALQLTTTRPTLHALGPQLHPRTSEDLREPLLCDMYIRELPRTSENILKTSEDIRGPFMNLRELPRTSEDFRGTTHQHPRSSEKFRALPITSSHFHRRWGLNQTPLLPLFGMSGPHTYVLLFLLALVVASRQSSTVTPRPQAQVTKHSPGA
jgi:hypothetical protein